MKKGFTLIELLAVIVILAIIALIATPLILNTIEDSRKGAFKNSAYGIIKAAELSYAMDTLNGDLEEITITYDNYTEDNPTGKKLQYKGQKPKDGEIRINSKGEIALAIYDGKYCAEKFFDESEVNISETDKEDCKIPFYLYKEGKYYEYWQLGYESIMANSDFKKESNYLSLSTFLDFHEIYKELSTIVYNNPIDLTNYRKISIDWEYCDNDNCTDDGKRRLDTFNINHLNNEYYIILFNVWQKYPVLEQVLGIGGVSISTERIDTELEESVFVEVGPSSPENKTLKVYKVYLK